MGVANSLLSKSKGIVLGNRPLGSRTITLPARALDAAPSLDVDACAKARDLRGFVACPLSVVNRTVEDDAVHSEHPIGSQLLHRRYIL